MKRDELRKKITEVLAGSPDRSASTGTITTAVHAIAASARSRVDKELRVMQAEGLVTRRTVREKPRIGWGTTIKVSYWSLK